MTSIFNDNRGFIPNVVFVPQINVPIISDKVRQGHTKDYLTSEENLTHQEVLEAVNPSKIASFAYEEIVKKKNRLI